MRDGQRCNAGRIWITAARPSQAAILPHNDSDSDSDFKHEAGFQYRGDVLCLGRGSDLFICYLETQLSMIAKLETGLGMNCVRLQPPLEIRVTPRVQPLACVRQASPFLDRTRRMCPPSLSGTTSLAVGSTSLWEQEKSRADLQSSRSGTSVRLPQSTGLVRSADVAMANGDDRVLGRICLTSFCWAS